MVPLGDYLTKDQIMTMFRAVRAWAIFWRSNGFMISHRVHRTRKSAWAEYEKQYGDHAFLARPDAIALRVLIAPEAHSYTLGRRKCSPGS
jgi:hypothetical protein